jgi:hypothetical protein
MLMRTRNRVSASSSPAVHQRSGEDTELPRLDPQHHEATEATVAVTALGIDAQPVGLGAGIYRAFPGITVTVRPDEPFSVPPNDQLRQRLLRLTLGAPGGGELQDLVALARVTKVEDRLPRLATFPHRPATIRPPGPAQSPVT